MISYPNGGEKILKISASTSILVSLSIQKHSKKFPCLDGVEESVCVVGLCNVYWKRSHHHSAGVPVQIKY